MHLEELWNIYGPKLKAYIMKYVSDRYEVEDILQEAGARMQKNASKIKEIDDTQIPQSNVILFNGVPIVSWRSKYQRTTAEYEDIPAKAIRQAAIKILGLGKKTTAPIVDLGCGCNLRPHLEVREGLIN